MAKPKISSHPTSNSDAVRVHMVVDVPGDVYDKVQRTTDRPVESLAGAVGAMLQSIASGGEMVSPELMGRIKGLIGQDASVEDVIPYIEKALNRKRGKFSCEVTIDPVYIRMFEDAAKKRGVDVQTYVQDVVNRIIRSGWVFNMLPEVSLLMTEVQRRELAEAMGVHESQVNGESVLEFVKALTSVTPR